MTNIERLIEELVSRCVITGCVGDIFIDFVRRNGGLRDVSDKDVFDIVAEISGMKFGTGLNLSDEWLPEVHKKRTNLLMAEACAHQGASDNDPCKLFAIYIAVCERNMIRQT